MNLTNAWPKLWTLWLFAALCSGCVPARVGQRGRLAYQVPQQDSIFARIFSGELQANVWLGVLERGCLRADELASVSRHLPATLA